MKLNCWPETFGVCFVAACVALAVLGWPNWNDVSSQTAASWFQAVGSVLAIFVSAGLVWWQHELTMNLEQKRRALDRHEKFEPFVGLIAQARWLVRYVNDAISGDVPPVEVFDTDAIITDLEYLLDAMRKVPVHELPTTYLCTYFIDACRLLAMLSPQVGAAKNIWRQVPNGDLWRERLKMMPVAVKSIDNIDAAFQSASNALMLGKRPSIRVQR